MNRITKCFFDVMENIDVSKYNLRGLKKILLSKWLIKNFEVVEYHRGYNYINHINEFSDERIKKDIKSELILLNFENNGIIFNYKGFQFNLYREYLTSDSDLYLCISSKVLRHNDAKIKIKFLDDFFEDDLNFSKENFNLITEKIIEIMEELISKEKETNYRKEVKKETEEKSKEKLLDILKEF